MQSEAGQAPDPTTRPKHWWPKGVSGNPGGRVSRKTRHRKMVEELVADLGDVRPIDRILVEQAAWLLVQGEDHQRARNSGKPVSDEDMTRCANGAARILLRLREGKPEPQESVANIPSLGECIEAVRK
jgi:hypothetical protein